MSDKPIWLPAPGLTYIGSREAAVISYHNRPEPDDMDQDTYIAAFLAGMRWERALLQRPGLATRIHDAVRLLVRGY